MDLSSTCAPDGVSNPPYNHGRCPIPHRNGTQDPSVHAPATEPNRPGREGIPFKRGPGLAGGPGSIHRTCPSQRGPQAIPAEGRGLAVGPHPQERMLRAPTSLSRPPWTPRQPLGTSDPLSQSSLCCFAVGTPRDLKDVEQHP